MPTIGQKLHERRLDLSLKIEDVAHDTHIHPLMLEGIEQDDFSRFPSVSYAKSFIRQYGERLGLNLDEALESLEGHSKLRDDEILFARETRSRRFRMRWPRRKNQPQSPFTKKKKSAPWLLNLVILLLTTAILIFYFIGYDTSSPEQAKEEIVRQLTRPIVSEETEKSLPSATAHAEVSDSSVPLPTKTGPQPAAEKAPFIPRSLVDPMVDQAEESSSDELATANRKNSTSPLRPKVTPAMDLKTETPPLPSFPSLPPKADSTPESVEVSTPVIDPTLEATKKLPQAVQKSPGKPVAPILRAVPVVTSE